MSLISEVLLKTASISNHIMVLTDKTVLISLNKHVKKLPSYREETRIEIGNLLHTISYLRKSYEAETRGKALSTMAAKHKDLISKILDLLFPDNSDSLQQSGEIYAFFTYYLQQIKQVEQNHKETAA